MNLFYHFNEVGAYFCHRDCCDTLDEQYDAWLALTADFDENSLCAIKCASMETYFCTLVNVNLIGTQIDELFGCGLCNGNELLHLSVGDYDWDILAVFWGCAVLKKVYSTL